MIINAKHLDNTCTVNIPVTFSILLKIHTKILLNLHITVQQHYVWNVCLHEIEASIIRNFIEKNITHLGLFLSSTVPRDCPNLEREFCRPLTVTQVVDIKLVL